MAIQIRRGSKSSWDSNKSNIVAGEPVIATDTGQLFVGTGNGTSVEIAGADFYADTNNVKILKFTNGVLIQWGYVAVTIPTANTQVDYTVSFTVPFADANYVPVCNALATVGVDIVARVRAQTANDLTIAVKRSNTTTTYIGWLAIGKWR